MEIKLASLVALAQKIIRYYIVLFTVHNFCTVTAGDTSLFEQKCNVRSANIGNDKGLSLKIMKAISEQYILIKY